MSAPTRERSFSFYALFFFSLLLAQKVFMFMLHWLPLSEARGHLEYVVQASNAGLPPSTRPALQEKKKKWEQKTGGGGGGGKSCQLAANETSL